MNGVFSLGKVSDDKTKITFNFTNNTPNQVMNYVNRIVEQSDELYGSTINTVELISNNRIVLSKERLSALKATKAKHNISKD